jgi:acetyltransferase
MYVEGIKDGRRFMDVAQRVVRSKPVLALRSGRSASGMQVALSHSGSLAGEDRVYDAAFRQCGIIRVEDTEELVDMCRTFLTFPLLKGNRLAVMTFTMGGGSIVADACEKYNMRLAALSEKTREQLCSVSPSWLVTGNPVDLGALVFSSAGPREAFRISAEALLEDFSVDALLLIIPTQQLELRLFTDLAVNLAEKYKDKPVALWLYGPDEIEKAAAGFQNSGRIVNYPSPERAVAALSKLAQYSAYIRQFQQDL